MPINPFQLTCPDDGAAGVYKMSKEELAGRSSRCKPGIRGITASIPPGPLFHGVARLPALRTGPRMPARRPSLWQTRVGARVPDPNRSTRHYTRLLHAVVSYIRLRLHPRKRGYNDHPAQPGDEESA